MTATTANSAQDAPERDASENIFSDERNEPRRGWLFCRCLP